MTSMVPIPELPDWAQHAACIDAPSDMFFPPPGVIPVQAMQICAGCPVRTECLNHALDNNERHGVWGGMTTRERQRLRMTIRRHPASRDGAA